MGAAPSTEQEQPEDTPPAPPHKADDECNLETKTEIKSTTNTTMPAATGSQAQGQTSQDPIVSFLNIPEPPEIKADDDVIIVMGVTGSGKTTFVNYFADVELEIGHGLEPCTQDVQIIPCTLETGKMLWLVDTPGFDDTYRTDAEILREIANWLNTAYKKQIKLTGIIYLHRILDVRVGGAGVKNLRMFKRLCGDDGLGSVVLATTMWSFVPDEATGKRREKELQTEPIFWKRMIENGSKVFRQDRGRKSGAEIVNYLIEKKRPVTLDIQREMVDKKMQLLDTGAGAEVATQVEKASQAYERQLQGIRKELQELNEQRDHEAKKDLEEYKKTVESKIAKDQEEIKKLQADSDQLFQQMKQKYEQEIEKWTALIKDKDKQIEEAKNQAELARQKNDNDVELEKYKMQMQLKERYYKMVYASRCVVM